MSQAALPDPAAHASEAGAASWAAIARNAALSPARGRAVRTPSMGGREARHALIPSKAQEAWEGPEARAGVCGAS